MFSSDVAVPKRIFWLPMGSDEALSTSSNLQNTPDYRLYPGCNTISSESSFWREQVNIQLRLEKEAGPVPFGNLIQLFERDVNIEMQHLTKPPKILPLTSDISSWLQTNYASECEHNFFVGHVMLNCETVHVANPFSSPQHTTCTLQFLRMISHSVPSYQHGIPVRL